MKKSTIIILVIVGFIAILGLSLTNDYNSMINLREDVKTKEADIDVALKRRSDLIPNLVSTVKGYAQHEEKVISDITTARENLVNDNDEPDLHVSAHHNLANFACYKYWLHRKKIDVAEAFLQKYMIERNNLEYALKDMSCINDYVTIEY